MSEPFVFDPRCDLCKEPFGAVPCGTAVTFHCRPLATEGFSHCALVLSCEFSGTQREQELPLEGPAGERLCFSGTLIAPELPDLLWYHFRFWREDGTGCLLDKTGYRSDGQAVSWQLTVYQESRTPGWFGAGVTYQIFPDRFCRLALVDSAGLVGRRWVHEDWDDTPEWRPDPDGEIRNRDFFGGDLAGVREKLGYLRGLGVDTLYFCPIFEAPENHRYGTGDYEKIDPMLGTEADFRALCTDAHALGMRVVLDGVFNHQGFVSRYFNGDGSYESVGAVQSQDSPYYPWYHFSHWPDKYDSWWGIYSLPAVNEADSSYRRYIFGGADSIIRRWLAAGADGWRLDVADELPDDFIHGIHAAARQAKPEAVIIGEVWEDGSNKIAYGVRRRHILGGHCDGLMNYPFRNALLSFLLGEDAFRFRQAMETLRENYPPFAWRSAMNFLGTHDTPRILTALVDDFDGSREEKARRHLSRNQLPVATERLLMASFLQYTLPGSPSLYYADEAGMEGYRDPFNRRTYPWGREDPELLAHFRRLGQLRKNCDALRLGDIQFFQAEDRRIGFTRRYGDSVLKIYCNRCGDPWDIPAGKILLGHNLQTVAPDWLTLAPKGFCIVEG